MDIRFLFVFSEQRGKQVSPQGDTANKSRRKAIRQTSLAARRYGKQVSPQGDTANK
jgi:hypothetical protein